MQDKIIEEKLNEYSEYLNLLFDEPEKYSFSEYSKVLIFLEQSNTKYKYCWIYKLPYTINIKHRFS